MGNSAREWFARGLLKGLDPSLVPLFQGWPETAACIYTEGKCQALSRVEICWFLSHEDPVIQSFHVCARFAAKFS